MATFDNAEALSSVRTKINAAITDVDGLVLGTTGTALRAVIDATASDIATAEASIVTNAGNISTNTADIATNTAAIDLLEGGGSGGSHAATTRALAVSWAAANPTPGNGFRLFWPDGEVIAEAGSTVISDMGGFRPPKGPWTPQTFGDINGTTDSATIQAMWDATTGGQNILFPGDVTYGINATIDANMAERNVTAQGARFVLSVDSYAFDFNPDADKDDVETAQKSFGEWSGGTFTSTVASPTATAAFRMYACRQMRVSDCTFGDASATLVHGILLSALGGHFFENLRFFYNAIGVNCPKWAIDGPGQPISTSTFINCNWTMRAAQADKAVYNACGANRWTFNGGFANGTTAELFHFTNAGSEPVRSLKWINFGFEQAVAGGKFVYLEDADAGHSGISNVSFDTVEFNGNPSGVGTHIHVDCERVKRMSFQSVISEAANNPGAGKNNWSFQFNATTSDISFDKSCRCTVPSLVTDPMFNFVGAFDRRLLDLPDKFFTPTYFTSINNSTYSSGTTTIDMATLLSGNIADNGAPPIGYTFSVLAKDSDTSAGDRRVIFGNSAMGESARPAVFLNGPGNGKNIHQTVYVPASADGNVEQTVYASGTNTFTMTVRVAAIHN